MGVNAKDLATQFLNEGGHHLMIKKYREVFDELSRVEDELQKKGKLNQRRRSPKWRNAERQLALANKMVEYILKGWLIERVAARADSDLYDQVLTELDKVTRNYRWNGKYTR
jgi:hypothetical protein